MGEKDTIPALERAIDLVNAVAEGLYFHSVSELSRQLGIPQTTCYRIIRTLIDADWLRPRAQGQGYDLSFGLLPLLRPFDSQRVLINAVHPAITELTKEAGLSAKLSARNGCEAITIHRADCDRPIALTGRIGVHFHLAYGSSGSALMSGMSDADVQKILDKAPAVAWRHQKPDDVWRRVRQCREKGWCIDSGGYSPRIHTISAALRGGDGEVWTALTLLGMPGDLDEPRRAGVVEHLMACIERCQDAMKPVASSQ